MKQYNEKHINKFSKQEIEKLGAQGQLIDVSTEEVYELAHINGATLHAGANSASVKSDKNTTDFVHCKSGTRSTKASEYLAEQGYDIVNLDGGYKAYEAKNEDNNTLEENTNVEIKAERKQLNYSGLQCPGPIVNISKE